MENSLCCFLIVGFAYGKATLSVASEMGDSDWRFCLEISTDVKFTGEEMGIGLILTKRSRRNRGTILVQLPERGVQEF
jgi:hypothetical protein